MTNQVSLPRSGATPASERTSSGAPGTPFKSLFVYGAATVLVAAAVTVAALAVSDDDAPTIGGYSQQHAPGAAGYAARVRAHENAQWAAAHGARLDAYTDAQAGEQQLVNGIDPAVEVPSTIGVTVTDGSFQANETARFEALAPTLDTSYQVGETARMQALAPTLDSSSQAETARMRDLVAGIDPAIDVPSTIGIPFSDASFQANETARMLALAPPVSVPEGGVFDRFDVR